MRIHEPTEKVIDGVSFFIRPLPAFTSSRIGAELTAVFAPALGVAALHMDSIQGAALDISGALSALSGEKIEKLLRLLLIDQRTIAVEWEGETRPLNEDLVNEIFCGETQNLYILAGYVIQQNFQGFFDKIIARFGPLIEAMEKKSENTESSTLANLPN